ncbi:MAG: glycoside hydrolase family 88 protein [Bacteroidia bacterium]|nr:glycoside hydrolase family 88 protein [Bacteroidia bacterium]
MKLITCICLILLFAYQLKAQEDEIIVRKVADNVLKNDAFQFEGVYNNQTYNSSKDIPDTVTVRLKSPYSGWYYVNGVLNMAMIDLGDFLKDEKYTNHAIQHVTFSLENYKYFENRKNQNDRRIPFRPIINIRELDDCGAMGASVIEVYQKVNKPEFRSYIDRTANHITNIQERLEDGTLVRKAPNPMTLWADDLYMSVPFLARMGKLTGDTKYYDDAIRQVLNFDKYLWDPGKELYYHCYFDDLKRNGVAHWGRCNGWIMCAQVHLLNMLPTNYPKRDLIIKTLERQIVGISKYQNGNGIWYQVLDKNDSYPESSCTAMFVYSIARAVNEGWIDKRYASIALTGWDGLKKLMITPDGQMKDVCVGTGIQNDLFFYYNRPAKADDTHGTGSLIEAGIEVIKLKKNMIRRN